MATTKLSKKVTTPDGDTVALTAGDIDEAVSGLLTNGLAAGDVNGESVPAGSPVSTPSGSGCSATRALLPNASPDPGPTTALVAPYQDRIASPASSDLVRMAWDLMNDSPTQPSILMRNPVMDTHGAADWNLFFVTGTVLMMPGLDPP